MSKIAIKNTDGATVEIDVELFKGYQEEAFEYLRQEADQKANFKDAVETLADTIGVDKKVLTKYIKQRFKDATKEQTVLGEFFASLDDAQDGNSQD